MQSDLLKLAEVKREFGYSGNALRMWEAQGALKPVYTPGGHRRYARADLEQLGALAKAAQASTSSAFDTSQQGNGELNRRDQYREFGVTGLRQWSGSVYEERLRQL